MTPIWVKNHAVFKKPFRYYWKVISESADHGITVLSEECMALSSLQVWWFQQKKKNVKKNVENKNVEK